MESPLELFKNNLLNWVVLVILLGILWAKNMPKVFEGRRRKIETAINEAAAARSEGQKFITEQRTRIENAEKEAAQILVEAKQVAERMKLDIAEQTKKDAADLEKKIGQQIATHRQMVITELRSQAATVAVRLAEASLNGAITGNIKQGLQERFITQLDQIGSNR
jgi:F-type H+-transporting ATPase subunit b